MNIYMFAVWIFLKIIATIVLLYSLVQSYGLGNVLTF